MPSGWTEAIKATGRGLVGASPLLCFSVVLSLFLLLSRPRKEPLLHHRSVKVTLIAVSADEGMNGSALTSPSTHQPCPLPHPTAGEARGRVPRPAPLCFLLCALMASPAAAQFGMPQQEKKAFTPVKTDLVRIGCDVCERMARQAFALAQGLRSEAPGQRLEEEKVRLCRARIAEGTGKRQSSFGACRCRLIYTSTDTQMHRWRDWREG